MLNAQLDKPIVFTANTTQPALDIGAGSMVKAPISGIQKTDKSDTALTEINNDYKYGAAADDNSGSLTYVKICAGARSAADIEIKRTELNGVGNGTKIENIYVLGKCRRCNRVLWRNSKCKPICWLLIRMTICSRLSHKVIALKNCYGVWERDSLALKTSASKPTVTWTVCIRITCVSLTLRWKT